MRILSTLLALLLAASGASASTLELLRSANQHGRDAGVSDSDYAAKWNAARGWDQPGNPGGDEGGIVSPPLLPKPIGASLSKPQANLIVGTPGAHQVREPKTPLTEDGKAKKQSSGNQIWWALGGAAVGAGLGFLLFGPIGALIGGLIAGAAGYFFGP